LSSLRSHSHAPSLPEMKNGWISSSNHLNTMGNPFKLCISLIASSIVSAATFTWRTNSLWFSGAHLVIQMWSMEWYQLWYHVWRSIFEIKNAW
jgi:hypothetical protein